MKKITLEANNKVFYEAFIDPTFNCLYSSWHGFVNVEQVKNGSLAGLELLKKYNCPYLINDNTDLTGPWKQANDWIESYWFPQAMQAGLRFMGHVLSDNVFAQLSAQDLEKRSDNLLTMRLFEDISQAKMWIYQLHHSSKTYQNRVS